MDTTFVCIMLVVFLVFSALAVNIGYLYVDEDDLLNMAQMSSLTGVNTIKKRQQDQLRADPGKLENISSDTVQSDARMAVIDHVTGKHRETALMQTHNNNTNSLTTSNDMTVGFWNISTHVYTPGGTPVNAMQVRTRRTAESESVGIGNIGNIIGILTGVQKFNYTPEAIAALPARANTNFALCTEACGSSCSFPNVCPLPEKRLIRDPWQPGMTPPTGERYVYTSLLYPQNLSDMICMDTTPQEVCGKQILTIVDNQDNALRDMESMMYNPNVDVSNKEFDKAGKLVGWWVIAPVTDCQSAPQSSIQEKRKVTKYALVRISRICVSGTTGCKQNNTSFDAPAATCGKENGLFIDRISCVNCGSKALLEFPGLRPALVSPAM